MKFAQDNDKEKGDIFKENELIMGTSSRSFELESWSYIQHKDYQLHVLRKKTYATSRKMIPASETERLTFMRVYVTSIYMTEIITTSTTDVLHFAASLLLTVFLKVLPQYYIIIFLSNYCPEEHFYLSKMVPIMWGTKLQIIISSILRMTACIDILALLLDYMFSAIAYQNPWNTCYRVYLKPYVKKTMNIDKKIKCFDNEDFTKLVKTEGVKPIDMFFLKQFTNGSSSIMFWSSFMHYFFVTKQNMFVTSFQLAPFIYHWILWIATAAYSYAAYYKIFYKILKISNFVMLSMYILIIIYVSVLEMDNPVPEIKDPVIQVPDAVLNMNLNEMSWQVLAPPVLHVLYARKSQPVNPSWDCAMIVVSSLLYTMILVFSDIKVRELVEGEIRHRYLLHPYNAYATLFYYPLLFSMFYFGNFFNLVYFAMSFIQEFSICSFMYFTTIEVIICEWKSKWLKSWVIILIITVIYNVTYIFFRFYTRIFLYVFGSIITACTEVAALSALYPMNRLIDDIIFNTGTVCTKLKQFSLLFFPLYFIYSTYASLESLYTALTLPSVKRYLAVYFDKLTNKSWIVPLVPLILGFIYALVFYVLKEKKSVSSLFRPLAKWGPPDHVTRQLRKQFDSREYVPSQSSRYLSRYMLDKGSAQVYRLDVRYESPAQFQRRTTVLATLEDE